MVKNIWDGLLSFLCAAVTVMLCGVPIWCSHLAITYGIVPAWIYGVLGVFGFLAILLTFDFLRKAIKGIAPLNERRR
ncbi:hypothetical protein [Actibacterium sp. 188UL27-1]|uniref:hypothetical protein n=1 Tax=Actibacterium sp. 188UL27-1 TaxID=2786961 RepID=UPI00195E7190|nr:hypothetical protein [Actibacterium sp. 188UL27-1]MBM7067753.1 hypothetical protein [Actibacterium sp. 188UL27-1]